MKCTMNIDYAALTINNVNCSLRNIADLEQLQKLTFVVDELMRNTEKCFSDFAHGAKVKDIANRLAIIESKLDENLQILREGVKRFEAWKVTIEFDLAKAYLAKIRRALT